MTKRLLIPALFGLLLCAPPSLAQDVADAGPAVPNVPRAVTPQSVAAPPAQSPDASEFDASDAKSLDAPATAAPADASEGKSLDAPAAADSETDFVIVTVNDEPISEYELRQRIALCVATNICPPLKTDADRKRVRAQIIEALEREKMQFQEAQKKHITVSPVEVNKRISDVAAQSHITVDQLGTILENAGSNLDALRTQYTAQMAWGKAVSDEYADDVNISQADIDAAWARAVEGANKTHYTVSEIFLQVDKPDQDAKVQKDAQTLYEELQTGTSFPDVAREFSQNPTAAQGGLLGTVYDGQLAPELNHALAGMKKGETSKPIRSSGGYYILYLTERQEGLGTKIDNSAAMAPPDPNGSLPLARLLLPIAPDAPPQEVDNVSKVAGRIFNSFTTCEKLADWPKQIPIAVYADLGNMQLKALDPTIQKTLAATRPGEMAAPVRDEQGIEMIARCDPRVEVRTAFTVPTRDEIRDQLFDNQIAALANRYLRDLRRDADIEVR